MMALDHIAQHFNLTWKQNTSWKSDTAQTILKIVSPKDELQEYHVTFLKPRKFMNISGSCVAQAGNMANENNSNNTLIFNNSQGSIDPFIQLVHIS